MFDEACANTAYHDSRFRCFIPCCFTCTFFTSYTSHDFGYVRMGNDNVSKIISMENICLETSTRYSLVLRDVRHVLDIRLNLISTGKLDNEGFSNQFG